MCLEQYLEEEVVSKYLWTNQEHEVRNTKGSQDSGPTRVLYFQLKKDSVVILDNQCEPIQC
jgi:hypothetical protein